MRSGRGRMIRAALGAGVLAAAAATAIGAPGRPGDVRPASDFVREAPCASSRLRVCLGDLPLPIGWDVASFTPGSTARRYLVDPVVDIDGSGTDAVVVDDPASTGAAIDVVNGHRYWLRVYASESVGGVTETSATVERDFRVDETPPTAAVSIAGGAAFTRTREVTAEVPAADPPTAGAFPASGLGAVAAWSGPAPPLDDIARGYVQTVPVTLAGGPDGPRSVSAVVFDRARHPLSQPFRLPPLDLGLFPDLPVVRLAPVIPLTPIELPSRPFTPILTPRLPIGFAEPPAAQALAIPILIPRIERLSPLVPVAPAPPPALGAPTNGNRSPVVVDEIVLDTTAPAAAVSVAPPGSPAGIPVTLSAAASVDATSGVAPARIAWNLGDGATATGPRVAHAYRAAGTYDGSVAVPDNAGNVATATFRVRVTAALDTDGALRGGALTGAARTTGVRPRLSVRTSVGAGLSGTRARLAGSWRESVLRGEIVVSARALRALRLTAVLRPRGAGLGAARRLRSGLAVARGRLERPLPLPPGLLPGSYDLEIASTGGPVLRRVLSLRIPAPREGVASSASVALAPTGAPAATVAAGTRRLFARFRLAVLPAGARRISVTWYHPDGRPVGTALKSRRPRVVSFVRSSDPLPSGRWRAVLSAGRVRVVQAAVRVRAR